MLKLKPRGVNRPAPTSSFLSSAMKYPANMEGAPVSACLGNLGEVPIGGVLVGGILSWQFGLVGLQVPQKVKVRRRNLRCTSILEKHTSAPFNGQLTSFSEDILSNLHEKRC